MTFSEKKPCRLRSVVWLQTGRCLSFIEGLLFSPFSSFVVGVFCPPPHPFFFFFTKKGKGSEVAMALMCGGRWGRVGGGGGQERGG